ncbi:MAG: hypothetical protein ACKVY0_19260 [Prosthecobacter sp.]|uniref:hypothetical protein n=1 Tax=Prosthecobacter sp. TaxID=1965333 RepID=UPI0038FD8B92
MLLIGGLIMIWSVRSVQTSVPHAQNSVPVTQAATAKAPTPLQPAKAAPFRWQQLDAPDFPTFVKNLRAIGCPEPTLRDILQGELREIYEEKRRQVAASTSGSLREAETLKLTTEQDRLLASLTAPATSPPPPLTEPSQPSGAAGQPSGRATTTSQDTANTTTAPDNPAANIPVAFTYGSNAGAALAQAGGQLVLSAPVTNPQLPPATATTLQQMQSDFAEGLGGSVQNPKSPAYQQDWNAALVRSNDRFSSLFGGDAFVRAQIEAVQAAAAAR